MPNLEPSTHSPNSTTHFFCGDVSTSVGGGTCCGCFPHKDCFEKLDKKLDEILEADMEQTSTIQGSSIWTMQENPLFHMTCPHCKNTIIMTREPVMTRLIKWAKALKDVI